MNERTTEYKNIIEENMTDNIFTDRVLSLQKIQSHHMFPIQKIAIADYPFIIYVDKVQYDLQNIIDNKIQLLPSQIKCIIWQITKLMLTCSNNKINHLRLYPRSIIFRQKYENENDILIMIKDFSLGKQFNNIKQGKIQQIFQYLHPKLSINNSMIDFNYYTPQYDIWSIGIILYKLIYFQSPFIKIDKTIFSKTILRKYLDNNYQIIYKQNKYDSINKFISKCLYRQDSKNYFKSWQQIKYYILKQQEIYHDLDFYDGNFNNLAQIHLQTMIFLSIIYCMIIDQCKLSQNIFWKIPISKNNNIPFHINICQFTLTIMLTLQTRFKRIYQRYYYTLKKQLKNNLQYISQRLKDQINFKKDKWINKILYSQIINIDIITIIQDICVRIKLEISQQNQKIQFIRKPIDNNFDSKIIKQKRSRLLMKKKSSVLDINKNKDRKIWKSIQILHDYCNQILDILATSKTRMKYIYQQFYINSVFHSIFKQQFGCKSDFSELFKNVYKEYS